MVRRNSPTGKCHTPGLRSGLMRRNQVSTAGGDEAVEGDVLTAEGIGAEAVSDRAAAERYVAKVCFKTGPPRMVGTELEWTVHHRGDPARSVDPATLVAALGD